MWGGGASKVPGSNLWVRPVVLNHLFWQHLLNAEPTLNGSAALLYREPASISTAHMSMIQQVAQLTLQIPRSPPEAGLSYWMLSGYNPTAISSFENSILHTHPHRHLHTHLHRHFHIVYQNISSNTEMSQNINDAAVSLHCACERQQKQERKVLPARHHSFTSDNEFHCSIIKTGNLFFALICRTHCVTCKLTAYSLAPLTAAPPCPPCRNTRYSLLVTLYSLLFTSAYGQKCYRDKKNFILVNIDGYR